MSPETPPNPQSPLQAVALAYDPLTAAHLPRVVASGKGAIAEQILRLAFDNGVKVRKDATLTEMLGLVELDHEIPLPALVAVAEILSYVYRENGKMKQIRETRAKK